MASASEALLNLGEIADGQHDFERAETLVREALSHLCDLGSLWQVRRCLMSLGWVAGERGLP